MNWYALVQLLNKLVGPEKIGGWVRGAIAAALVAVVSKYPPLGTILDTGTQTQIAALVATIVVGIWSQLVKTDSAKLAAVEAMPSVSKITVVPVASSAAVAAVAADPSRPKVST